MDAEDVNEYECKTDHDTCDIGELGLGCNTEDSKYKDECEQDLNEDWKNDVVVIQTVGTETAVKAALDPSFKLVKVLLFHVGSSYEVDVSITPHNDAQMNLSKFRATRESLELELKKLYPNLVLQVFLI